MPDFEDYVRQHLGPIELSGKREAEVVEEIAEHMRVSYEEARGRGETESAALAFAESPFVPWDRLRRNIERAENTALAEAGLEGVNKNQAPIGVANGITTMLESLWQDVRFALRALRRSPGFTFVALATLALGIGATTAMVSVLNTALGRALPFRHPEQLVLGRGTWNGYLSPLVSYPNYMDYRDKARSLESLATILATPRSATITGSGDPQNVSMLDVSSNLFETLGVNPHLGRPSTLDELPRGGGGEVVVSYGLWQRWFGGSPNVLGRTLAVNGNPLTVVGVMPAGFRLWFDVDLWVPPWPGNADPSSRRYTNWFLVGRLAPDVTLDAARSEVDLISAQLEHSYPDTNRGFGLQLDGLHEATVEEYQQSLLLLGGAIVLVLLIACGNVANLLLARGSTRASELAVRAALGAARSRLTRQLLVECVILAMMAGALGVVLAIWLQELILRFVSMDLLGIREVGLSFTMLGLALALSLGTVLLFGLFPSLAAAQASPPVDLKEGRRGGTSGRGIRYRSGLVILQVALSLMLLLSFGLLIRSFSKLVGVDPGFRVENLLTASVSVPADKYPTAESATEFLQELQEEVEALPGVETVGMVNRLPIRQTAGNMRIWTPGASPEETLNAPLADLRAVLPGYFKTMGIPLVEGRAIEAADRPGSAPVVVLNRTSAEIVFGNESPLGRQVAVDVGAEEAAVFEVVGVVED
ncbi:MAG: ABC transporter permease, partial [Gemmatimonadota bacterium]